MLSSVIDLLNGRHGGGGVGVGGEDKRKYLFLGRLWL